MTSAEPRQLTIEIPLTLRVATKDDLPKLEWFGQYTHFRRLIARAYQQQLKGSRLMLVADSNGFPIGQVFIQFNSDTMRLANGTTHAYIYAFRVMDLFQGHGVGTWLMNEAEAIIRQRGFRIVSLAVVKTNINALRLYKRLGYKIVAEDPGRWHYRDHRGRLQYVNEPSWLLEKSLNTR